MKSRGSLTADVLRRVAEAISKLSDGELVELVEGEIALVPAGANRGPHKTVRSPRTDLTPVELEDLRRQLEALPTREAGTALLEAHCQTKEQLQQLVRLCDLPVRKDDSRAKLVVSLVEATIGFRLRSQAVQGEFGPR